MSSEPAILQTPELAPGTRVEIVGRLVNVRFRRRTGVVVRPDRWIDCYIVELDEPATYLGADGDEELTNLRVDVVNLAVIND
jgi:hypothetical protein